MPRRAMITLIAATLLVPIGPSLVRPQATVAQKIASAMAAAPASIAKGAMIVDRAGTDGKMKILRQGTNGWTCMPNDPKPKYANNNAMCMDANFADFMAAMRARKRPALKAMGLAFMLTSDQWISNTTPSAKIPTPDNEWHHVSSAMMIAYPDRSTLAGLPVKPTNTGAYVMWANTPYAHVMIPLK